VPTVEFMTPPGERTFRFRAIGPGQLQVSLINGNGVLYAYHPLTSEELDELLREGLRAKTWGPE
jgi:hypothetical protein